jgi:hypothetical protein
MPPLKKMKSGVVSKVEFFLHEKQYVIINNTTIDFNNLILKIFGGKSKGFCKAGFYVFV